MASIHNETLIEARPETVWAAVRDIGAVHERLAPGFVIDTRLENGARVVTFANGLVVRELIVDMDDAARRLVWAVVRGQLTHHNASLQVYAACLAASVYVEPAAVIMVPAPGYCRYGHGGHGPR